MKKINQRSVQMLEEPSKSTNDENPPIYDGVMIGNPSLSSIQFDAFKSRIDLNVPKKRKIGLVS